MEEKKAFFRLLGILVAGGVLTAGFIFCIDPFYHYHSAWFGLPLQLENEVYQTPGAARHMEYDSVILGTSMTENFRASWFEELGWDTVKLSYSGARSDDLKAILGVIFEDGRAPLHVVMDLNAYQLTSAPETAYVERPQYLYEKNLLRDVPYLYNFDVFMESLDWILDDVQGLESDLDQAYTWEEESLFGKEKALKSAEPVKRALLEQGKQQPDLEQMLKVCDQNLDNILPFIQAHPETRFFIFYPPYSMLYWEQEVLKGELWQMLEVYQHSMERLLPYENVEVYDFQDERERISDLSQYRDENHHRPEYNRYIFECIRDGKKRVTADNLEEVTESVYQYAADFDYESLWEGYEGDEG